jgi:site-specific recombinase XerD
MTASAFGCHVQRFFTDYLTTQRDLSPHTLASYRDAIKLLLAFASRRHRKPVVEIGFDDFSPELVLAFLEDLETTRSNTIRTRNVRLAAIHSFFRYVAAHEPEVLGTCQRICAIPVKRTKASAVVYLDYEEVLHILGSIDRSTPLGRRDYLLVLLLFETGARAQEMASLRTTALRLGDPPQARILGKGRKERICPLRKKTAELIRDHLRERGALLRDEALWLGARGEPLTRFGILRIVQRHVRRASKSLPSLASKRVGAHTFRHSAAIHLLRAGNDLTVIRSWLGHVSVITTDQYTDVDIEMKRRALEATEVVAPARRRSSWKKDPDLLTWLEAL